MEPTAYDKPARGMVPNDVKTHGGVEVPEEKQTMAGTTAKKKLAELTKEQRGSLPSPWAPEDARQNLNGAKSAWIASEGTSQT